MASKNKKTTPSKSITESTKTTVTRIKAVDSTPGESVAQRAAPLKNSDSVKAPIVDKKERSVLTPLIAIKDYFKGAWYELRQVRWPDRKATWSLTLAVLLFTAFFIVLIVALDAFFKFLFQQILV